VVEAKLKNLIEFLNDDKTYPLDSLLKMAIGHFQFEAIQPSGMEMAVQAGFLIYTT
jgi:Fic family protein